MKGVRDARDSLKKKKKAQGTAENWKFLKVSKTNDHMAGDAIQNQSVSNIHRKRKRLIDARMRDNSRASIVKRRKYIRDANITTQSKSVIVNNVPPNTSCLYST